MPYPLAAFNSRVKSSFWEARKSGIQDAKSIDLKVLFYFFIYYKLIITIMVEGIQILILLIKKNKQHL